MPIVANDEASLSREEYQAYLIAEHSKISRDLDKSTQSGGESDPGAIDFARVLVRRLNVVSEKLNNLDAAYRAALKKATEWTLALQSIQGRVAAELLAAAVGAVRRRDFSRADELIEEIGATDPDIRIKCNILRSDIAAENLDYMKAFDLAQQAGSCDPANSAALVAFASIAHDLGQFDHAISAYASALANDIASHGEDHPNVAVLLNNLGVSYVATGAYEKAVVCYERALSIDLLVFGEDHPAVAIDRSNLAGASRMAGDFDKAIACYDISLSIDLKLLGYDHPQVATDLNNLGSAWHDMGEYGNAIACYAKALASDTKSFGETHPQVATCLNNLGTAWRDCGDAKIARQYFSEALKIFTEKLGPHHANTIIVQRNLVDLAAD